LNICYYYQDLLPRPLHLPIMADFDATWGILPTSPLFSTHGIFSHCTQVFLVELTVGICGPPVRSRPFSRLPHSVGELLRTP